MPELVIEKKLVPWLEARDPRLANKVQPAAAGPHVTGPYCTFQRIDGVTWTDLGGPRGVHNALIRLVIWGQDHAEVRDIAAKIKGSVSDPGLHGFSGDMGGVTVQQAFVEDGPDLDEEPDDGSEAIWYGAVLETDLVWNEGD